ncbi:MAG TPA: glycosyl hydrolase family 28 protein [Mucilaginibacter sp.]|nr:glycosyl hydrolase family 28 protein [Mucilaginibacter sp.]
MTKFTLFRLLACALFVSVTAVYGSGKPKAKVVVYPAPAGEPLDQRYKVTVDGKNVSVYTAKIAANKSPDEFKGIADINNSHKYYDTCAFGYFDMQGSVMVTVTVPNQVTSVKVLPAAMGINATIHGHSVTFPVSSPKNLTVEINGEWEQSLHLFVNPLETNIPKANDPNVIYFGPGIHTISHLDVGSNKTLYIAGGAILRAVLDSNEKYTVNRNDKRRNYSPTLVLSGHNITIRGRGIIDASACPTHSRNLLFIRKASKVNLEGIILRDASTWTVPIRQSDSVNIDNIKLLGYRANSDGIDVCNSRYVWIKNCFIRTMDDLIVIKADNGQGDAKHIFATKCVLWNQLAHALSIGAEVSDNVDDVVFTDCDVIHDKGREWSLRVYQCDGGAISNVRFENIRIEEAHKFISLWIGHAVWTRKGDGFGKVSGVTFKNIYATGAPLTVDLVGIDADHGVKDVVFKNVVMNGKPLTKDQVKMNDFVSNVSVE